MHGTEASVRSWHCAAHAARKPKAVRIVASKLRYCWTAALTCGPVRLRPVWGRKFMFARALSAGHGERAKVWESVKFALGEQKRYAAMKLHYSCFNMVTHRCQSGPTVFVVKPCR